MSAASVKPKAEWSGTGPLPDKELEDLAAKELEDIRKNVWQTFKEEKKVEPKKPAEPEKPKDSSIKLMLSLVQLMAGLLVAKVVFSVAFTAYSIDLAGLTGAVLLMGLLMEGVSDFYAVVKGHFETAAAGAEVSSWVLLLALGTAAAVNKGLFVMFKFLFLDLKALGMEVMIPMLAAALGVVVLGEQYSDKIWLRKWAVGKAVSVGVTILTLMAAAALIPGAVVATEVVSVDITLASLTKFAGEVSVMLLMAGVKAMRFKIKEARGDWVRCAGSYRDSQKCCATITVTQTLDTVEAKTTADFGEGKPNPSSGTVDGKTISMFGLKGTWSDGEISWSDGAQWTLKEKAIPKPKPPVTVFVSKFPIQDVKNFDADDYKQSVATNSKAKVDQVVLASVNYQVEVDYELPVGITRPDAIKAIAKYQSVEEAAVSLARCPGGGGWRTVTATITSKAAEAVPAIAKKAAEPSVLEQSFKKTLEAEVSANLEFCLVNLFFLFCLPLVSLVWKARVVWVVWWICLFCLAYSALSAWSDTHVVCRVTAAPRKFVQVDTQLQSTGEEAIAAPSAEVLSAKSVKEVKEPEKLTWRSLTFQKIFSWFALACWSLVGVFVIGAGCSVLLIFAFVKLPATILYMRAPSIKKTKFTRAKERYAWTFDQMWLLFDKVSARIIKLQNSNYMTVKVVATVLCLMLIIVILDAAAADHKPIVPGVEQGMGLSEDYTWPVVQVPTALSLIYLLPGITNVPGWSW